MLERRREAESRESSCRGFGLPGGLRAALLAVLLIGGAAHADDPWELWPELNLYKRLGPTSRLYFVAAYAEGKESEFRTLDVAGYYDVTFRPFVRDRVKTTSWRPEDDWRQRKYMWIRLGYDHVFKQQGETESTPEDRGIVAIHGRAYLPEGILFEGRARADLRWIGGDYSTRWRLRAEVNRDFEVRGRLVTPYLQAEVMYDGRYDGWARELYQAGVEIELTRHFRVEPSFGRQVDRLPEKEGLWAFAFVARWYY